MHLKEIAFLASQSLPAARDFNSLFLRRNSNSVVVMDVGQLPAEPDDLALPRDSHGYTLDTYWLTRQSVTPERLLREIRSASDDMLDDDDDDYEDDEEDRPRRSSIHTIAYGLSSDGTYITNPWELTGVHEVYARFATTPAIFGLRSEGAVYVEAVTHCAIAVFSKVNEMWGSEYHTLSYREVFDVPDGAIVKVLRGDAVVVSSGQDLNLTGVQAADWARQDAASTTAELLKLGGRITVSEEQNKEAIASRGSVVPTQRVEAVISDTGHAALDSLLFTSGVVSAVRRLVADSRAARQEIQSNLRARIGNDTPITTTYIRNLSTNIAFQRVIARSSTQPQTTVDDSFALPEPLTSTRVFGRSPVGDFQGGSITYSNS